MPLISPGGSLVGQQYRPIDKDASVRFLTKLATGTTSALIGVPGWQPSDWIFFVEGATDWIAAAQRVGVGRTIGVAGAGNALATLQALKLTSQTRVYVALDDDHAGNSAADACLAYLSSKGITCYRVRFGGKKDVCEFLAGGGDLFEAIALSEQEAMLPVEDVMSIAPCAPRWLAENLIQQECCGVVGGSPKSFKTWMVLYWLICLVTGRRIFDKFRVPNRGTKALVYSPEGSASTLSTRIHQLCASMDIATSDIAGHIHRISERINFTADYHRIRETVRVRQPDVLLLDPLIAVAQVDENAAHELQPILDRIRDLRQVQPNLTVIITHHAGKANKDRAFGSLLRGSGCLHGWLDSLVTVRMSDEEDPNCARRVDIQHREAMSPGPLGFTLRDNSVLRTTFGMNGVQIAACDAPEVGGRSSSRPPKPEAPTADVADLRDYYRKGSA